MNTQNRYFDFECSPCVLLDEMNAPRKLSEYTPDTPWHLEACNEGDPNIVCWGVFGVCNSAGREAIADYLDKRFAVWMADRLREGLDLKQQFDSE